MDQCKSHSSSLGKDDPEHHRYYKGFLVLFFALMHVAEHDFSKL